MNAQFHIESAYKFKRMQVDVFMTQYPHIIVHPNNQLNIVGEDKQMAETRNFEATLLKHILTVTTPTADLTNISYLKQLIDPASSYQVIPSIPSSLIYDPIEVILSILPSSKHKLLDIAMPYSQDHHNTNNYFARYLLFNQQLVGIRVCCYCENTTFPAKTNIPSVKKWSRTKCIKQKISERIIKYYHQNKIDNYALQIPVGEFTLSFKQCKIAFLFESEYNEKMMHEYARVGSQIYSMVNDIGKDGGSIGCNSLSNKSLLESKLRKFAAASNRIVMYCGVKLAPSLDEVYLTNSFIDQHKVGEKYTTLSIFDQGASASMVCDLYRTKQLRTYDTQYEKLKYVQGIKDHYLHHRLHYHFSHRVGQSWSHSPTPIQTQKNIANLNGEIVKKMYIWYLFKEINQSSQFIIPLPITDRTRSLTASILQIAQYNQVDPNLYIKFYQTSKEQPVEKQIIETYKVYEDLKNIIDQNPQKKLWIYTDNSEQLRVLNRIAHQNEKIQICNLLMPQNQGSAIMDKFLNQREQKLQDFCDYILRLNNPKYETILEEAKHSKWNFSRDLIEQVFDKILRRKMRCQVKITPFYLSILKASRDQIIKALSEAEIAINDHSYRPAFQKEIREESKAMVDEGDRDNNQHLATKIKEIKKFKEKQKAHGTFKCHRCSCFMAREWGWKCQTCFKSICYHCIESILAVKTRSLEDLKKCIVCLKLCQCKECLGIVAPLRKEKQQSKNASRTQIFKNDFSRQDAMIDEVEVPAPMKLGLEYYKDCGTCTILDRKIVRIQVQCSKCNAMECGICVRSRSKKYIDFSTPWSCSICDPPVQPVIKPNQINNSPVVSQYTPTEYNQKKNEKQRKLSNSLSNSGSIKKPKKQIIKQEIKKIIQKDKKLSRSASRSLSNSGSIKREKKKVMENQPEREKKYKEQKSWFLMNNKDGAKVDNFKAKYNTDNSNLNSNGVVTLWGDNKIQKTDKYKSNEEKPKYQKQNNFYNNNNGDKSDGFRGRGRGVFRGNFNKNNNNNERTYNNNFDRNNNKKQSASRSGSRSGSIVAKKPNRKQSRSISGSNSPKRNASPQRNTNPATNWNNKANHFNNNNNYKDNKKRSASHSRSGTPPKRNNQQIHKRNPSNQASRSRSRDKNKKVTKKRSASSHSQSGEVKQKSNGLWGQKSTNEAKPFKANTLSNSYKNSNDDFRSNNLNNGGANSSNMNRNFNNNKSEAPKQKFSGQILEITNQNTNNDEEMEY